MTELSALIDGRISLLNAASKHLLVLTITMMLGPTGEFLRQMMVPGLHQPKIHVVVQRLGASDLFSSELAALERSPLADIQRPAIFTHMPVNVGDEPAFCQAVIMTAAIRLGDQLSLWRIWMIIRSSYERCFPFTCRSVVECDP
jgi:hypothetical protein